MINVEFEAEQLIEDFGLVVPINPIDVCASISSNRSIVEYHEREFETKDICGLSIGNGNIIQIFVNSKIIPVRRLFTAAHEIGHVILHILTGKKSGYECSKRDTSIREGEKLEAEANQFASALLMPQRLIEKKISGRDLTWQLIDEISKQYRTSLEAAARRVIQLTKNSCALIIHHNNQMLAPITSSSFPSFIPKAIFPKYLEKKNHIERNSCNRLEKCALSDWSLNLKSSQYNCYYSTLNFEAYNQIMTILSIEEVDEEEDTVWEEPHF